MADYTATLKDGSEIYVPTWNATVAYTNLTRCTEVIGIDALVNIAQDNVPAVVLALATAKDADIASQLLKHMVCEARMNGDKIMPNSFDETFKDQMYKAAEIFNHVIMAQYKDFFVQGLEEANSQ
jgi:hypothetical protein